jgi:hypothetical protein
LPIPEQQVKLPDAAQAPETLNAPAAPPMPVLVPPMPLPAARPGILEVPPPAPGEYTKKHRWHLRQDVLEWITPGCLVAIFLLSWFTWVDREVKTLNLWELAFTSDGYAINSLYAVAYLFVALPVGLITFSLEKRWLPMLEGLRPFWPWRSLIVAGVVGLPFVFFLVNYIDYLFLPFGRQADLAMKIAFRLHLVALVSSLLQFWLERRKSRNAPLPRLDVRW